MMNRVGRVFVKNLHIFAKGSGKEHIYQKRKKQYKIVSVYEFNFIIISINCLFVLLIWNCPGTQGYSSHTLLT